MRTLRRCLVLALFGSAIAAPYAREVRPPDHVAVGGGTFLRLAGEARRTHLLGAVELYTLALYTDGPADSARLASDELAKALRIEVTVEDDPRRRVALDWRREIVPRLEPPAAAHLAGSFAPLRHGDIVWIEYVPATGTSVRVNRVTAVSGAHHDLMLAFLDHWLGDRPVSEAIKRTLLARS